MLNSNGDNGHPCLVLDHRGKALSISHLRMVLTLHFLYMPLWCWGMLNLSLLCWGFYQELMLYFVKCFFCNYWGSYGSYPFFFFLLWCITLIDLWILNQLCSPGIHPAWSWWIILLMYCWIWFVNILLRIFASMFIRDIGLWFFLVGVFVWCWNQGNASFVKGV